jgi:hypothetical protein
MIANVVSHAEIHNEIIRDAECPVLQDKSCNVGFILQKNNNKSNRQFIFIPCSLRTLPTTETEERHD